MIVWVNGAFGSGKTTLVAELSGRWPEALVYDPEMVGFAVPRETLEQRIDGWTFFPDDPEREQRVRHWAKGRIEACAAAAGTLPGDTVLLDGSLAPGELADRVLARVRPGGA
ncbi:hypothetical protein [Streptomyces lavendulae]|uniref:hypothetical protein n=1 Tax=Streptomyces lavendulae TaxID=1914 RepID=UPI0036E5FBF8